MWHSTGAGCLPGVSSQTPPSGRDALQPPGSQGLGAFLRLLLVSLVDDMTYLKGGFSHLILDTFSFDHKSAALV